MLPLFPPVKPFRQSRLKVSDIHEIHYEQVGNPNGSAALFLHGGPGLGILPIYRRFFDPNHYHIILPDQRGAGRSTPYAELRDNDTWKIVADLERLRQHLGIKQWLVMGGSWGSLLALCYAIKHPNALSGLILRGVFLGRPRDTHWLFGGGGAADIFPDKWQSFKAHLGEIEDAQVIAGYNELLTSDDEQTAMRAAISWANYEAQMMTLLPDNGSSRDIAASDKMLALARTECHFAHHQFFLESDNFVLDNIQALREIPTFIVHGRYDIICPVLNAWDLHQKLPGSQLRIVADGAHIPTEPGMIDQLVCATESLKQ